MALVAEIEQPKPVINHIRTHPLAVMVGEQIRFPRSGRRRIRQRWADRLENYRTFPAIYRFGDTLVVHPDRLAEASKPDYRFYELPIATFS